MKIKDNKKGLVYKGAIAWKTLEKTIQEIEPTKVFVISDVNTYKNCLPYFLRKLKIEKTPEIITFPASEVHKNIHTCLKIWDELSEKGADRNSLIINLGGGVVTDLGGFVASTFKRGLRFINIPTSLLAMVDASVGGKNGIDLGHIKNQVGVINNPEMVLVDISFLKTLPKEHLVSGFAEMLKHGIIHSKKYWDAIKNIDALETTELENLIWESIEIKKEIIAKDPFEKNLRKTLNYGHTLGHAIESYCLRNKDKKTLLHGEAIAIGMVLATYISHIMLGFPKETLEDITKSILSHFPKQFFNQNDIDNIISLLIFDKKNINGKVLFVLMKDIANQKTDCVVDNKLIYSAFSFYENY